MDVIKKSTPLYNFVAPDGVRHTVWKIDRGSDLDTIYAGFKKVESVYIADGHHRAASAVKVGLKRREQNPELHGRRRIQLFSFGTFPT